MKAMCSVVLSVLLSGCNALGGIPPDTISTLTSAGSGCVAVESLVMGKAVMMVGSADKGVLSNGELTVGAGCGGIVIKNVNTAVPPVQVR